MKLTDKQKEILQKRLSHLKSAKCECGEHTWLFSDTIFELREFHGGNIIIGANAAVFPIITAVCKKCGNTKFYNAIHLGLLAEDPSDEE